MPQDESPYREGRDFSFFRLALHNGAPPRRNILILAENVLLTPSSKLNLNAIFFLNPELCSCRPSPLAVIVVQPIRLSWYHPGGRILGWTAPFTDGHSRAPSNGLRA